MNSPDDDKLDPAQERVLRKLRGFATFSAVLMGFGFLALFGAIGYRLVVGWKSAPVNLDGTVLLPKGARVLSASVSGDTLAVTVQRDGVVETRFFAAAGHAPRGVVRYAVEP